MNSVVSSRIAMLRFIMIFGVVVLHTPMYVSITDTSPDSFSQIKAFFQQAFFRGSVPVLTFISGYLMFNSDLPNNPTKLLKKKTFALLIPFLVFNFSVLALLIYTGQLKTGLLNAAFGIAENPANYPLNFLRDMMVLMVFVPLFGELLKAHSFIALAGIFAIFMGNYDGLLILRNDMPIVFFLGAMAAHHNLNMTLLDKHAKLCLTVFISLCIIWVYLKIANTNLLRFAAPFLLWPAAALLQDTRFGCMCQKLSKYSFFVFLAHAPILAGSYKAHTAHPVVPYPVYWLLAPVATVTLLIVVYEVAMKLFPTMFSLAIGKPKGASGRFPQTVTKEA